MFKPVLPAYARQSDILIDRFESYMPFRKVAIDIIVSIDSIEKLNKLYPEMWRQSKCTKYIIIFKLRAMGTVVRAQLQ